MQIHSFPRNYQKKLIFEEVSQFDTCITAVNFSGSRLLKAPGLSSFSRPPWFLALFSGKISIAMMYFIKSFQN